MTDVLESREAHMAFCLAVYGRFLTSNKRKKIYFPHPDETSNRSILVYLSFVNMVQNRGNLIPC